MIIGLRYLIYLLFLWFRGGDGSTYLDFTSIIYCSFLNNNLIDFLKEVKMYFIFQACDTFCFSIKLFQLLLFIFSLFFLPKFSIFKHPVQSKNILLYYDFFLINSIFHHLGFSYYQYIRHAYRLFPESLLYVFICPHNIFKNFKEEYLKMNLLFIISVFFQIYCFYCFNSSYKNNN